MKSGMNAAAEPATDCASRLKILADETRLAVLRTLLGGAQRVGELAVLLGTEQTLLSHHLQVLRKSGLVATRRDGKAILYELAEGVAARTSDGRAAIDIGCCKLLLD
jgi:DNA-binding transcriptional ArsR family regulator